ncbi:extracellular solute-binding protein family 1 [Ancylobacter novellus DSM 506]|uniref:Extracellular solute-binding protein family 1 n=1 Tax=Ancylobacter novellus (strain ATCC 8093 / DSM 506 / JCM 20403 / CCM 1077 / IAM 12100 / NBRC 12443 / NCIMB 10456) TaxID=639283 RepID=D7A2Q5_ANCN5|nr:extracellular solute-binding protein [Ancylobacter novellus]ADH91585.1 extracellular solute-binding protein family 1 [Ancylobacter novellus DSM 506]
MNLSRKEFLRLAIASGASAAFGLPRASLAAGLTGTVSYLTYEALPTTKKVTGELVAALEAANPGLKINVLFTSPEAVRKQVSSMLQSGSAPDLVNLDLEDAVLYGHAGLLEPVTSIVSKIENLPDRWRARLDGQDFFVPMGVKFTYSWYRSDLLEKAGLTPPKTWDEFQSAAAKLTGNGQYGYVVNSNETGDQPVSTLFSYAFSNGVNFIDDDGNILFAEGDNRAALADTLRFLAAMSKFSPSGAGFTWGDIINSFASGKVAMADYIGSRLYSVVAQNNPALAQFTKPFVQPYGKSPANRLSAEGFMVFRNAPNKEAAKAIAVYLREGRRYFDYLWSIPLHVLPTTKEAFLGDFQQDPFVRDHQDIAKVVEASWDVARNPVYDLNGKKAAWQRARIYTSTVYNKMLATVIQAGGDPNAAIEQAAKSAKSLLKNG